VFACGEATNGRLGLGISVGNVPVPRQLCALNQYIIKKVSVHSGKLTMLDLTTWNGGHQILYAVCNFCNSL